MRTSFLPVVLLAAASQAATYVNSFGNSDPALQFITNGPEGLAWDPTGPYVSVKPWDVVKSDGSVAISGVVSLSQSYINSYPSASASSAANFIATTTFSGLSGFKTSDITSLSYQLTEGTLNSAPRSLMLFLLAADGTTRQIYQANATITVTRSNGTDGDFIFTYTNFAADGTDATYAGIKLMSQANYAPLPGGGFGVARGQFLDITLQSASITTSGGTPPVPEPSTYGLVLGGLALAAVAIRRRRAK